MACTRAAVIVRPAQAPDHAAIDTLVEAAFAGRAEADLVQRLRADGDAAIELVAEQAGRVVGHVLFSPLQAPIRALALAPVSVLPELQRQGIGSALIRAAHELARQDGWDAIFVLGDPAYYRRFGYDPAAAEPFDSPYSGPHFMALPLKPALLPPSGKLRHAAAFQELDE